MHVKLGETNLRNIYTLYSLLDDEKYYVLESFKERNPAGCYQKVLKGDVESVLKLLSGENITVKDLMDTVRSSSEYFSFGDKRYKFRYQSQNLLIVLVCLKKAEFYKEGRKFVYHIY